MGEHTSILVGSNKRRRLLLHGAVDERAVVQHVRALVAVTLAGGEFAVAGVAVLSEAAPALAAVAVSDATGQLMRADIARSAQLEAVAVAGGQLAVRVGGATRERHGRAGLPEIPAVIRVASGFAILEHVAGACAELAGEAVGVLAVGGGVHVVVALAILDRVVHGTAALNLNARVLVAVGIARIDDATRLVVDVNAGVIHAGDGNLIQPDVVAVGNKPIGRIVEVERGRAGHSDTCRHITGTTDTVGARYIHCLARRGGLDGVNDVGLDSRASGQRDGSDETDLFTAVGC